jgi:hypothetical protein
MHAFRKTEGLLKEVAAGEELSDKRIQKALSDFNDERLQAGGFDFTSIAETGSGASDKDVLMAAGAEGCILITEDRDAKLPSARDGAGVGGLRPHRRARYHNRPTP